MQIDAVLDEELEWKPDPNDRHLEKFREVTRSRLPKGTSGNRIQNGGVAPADALNWKRYRRDGGFTSTDRQFEAINVGE